MICCRVRYSGPQSGELIPPWMPRAILSPIHQLELHRWRVRGYHKGAMVIFFTSAGQCELSTLKPQLNSSSRQSTGHPLHVSVLSDKCAKPLTFRRGRDKVESQLRIFRAQSTTDNL